MKKISIIIAAKSKDKKLKECLRSIDNQDHPDKEVLVITEGTPESAKAIGLKKAKGEIVCFVASDCEFTSPETFTNVLKLMTCYRKERVIGAFSMRYHYEPKDPILNRYFALFGFNDPVPFYLGKCDRTTYYNKGYCGRATYKKRVPTLGDNGFFINRKILMRADIEHYSHIDVTEDLRKLGFYEYVLMPEAIHHKTGDSLWLWIRKRFRYAESLNQNRRWKMLSGCVDFLKLLLFI